MSLALVFGMVQLMMMMNEAAEGGSLVENAVQGSEERQGPAEQAALVSRRRWYGSQAMPWNDHDMQWLKRDDDKRGWGNGIPPWMKHRVVVVPATAAEAARRKI